jgi:hypothetical protein
MNIFVLDSDPVKAARYHCNKHVVKMILESASMLAIPHDNPPCNKSKAWKNHPCTRWTVENTANYEWHCELAYNLCMEYTTRYHKRHKMQDVIEWYSNNLPLLPKVDCVNSYCLAMPDDCKSGDAIVSYRKYYMNYKAGFAKWPEGLIPYWWVFDTIIRNNRVSIFP